MDDKLRRSGANYDNITGRIPVEPLHTGKGNAGLRLWGPSKLPRWRSNYNASSEIIGA